MPLTWIREDHPTWSADKERIVGAVPGAFDLSRYPRDGGVLPGEWWRVEDGGRVVGYGWMDVVWGDGEVLLAVDPLAQRSGVGAFILGRLQAEAMDRGLARIVNVVRPDHPQGTRVTLWLLRQGFLREADGERLARRVQAPPTR